MSEPVTIFRCDDLGMITLRCDLAAPRLGPALAAALGCALPAPRRIEAGAGGAAAWMSPDELLLITPRAAVAPMLAALAVGLDGVRRLAVDVSDARVGFCLAGAGARETLAKGAPVDLAPGAFGRGAFRRTRLGQVAAALWTPEPGVFEVICARSVADFVASWLAVAAAAEARPGVFRD